ncbi:MAG: MAPEG family protein [Bdellovibrionota bacterium]
MNMNLQLVYPMFAMVVLTAVVLIMMFVTRVRAIRGGQMKVGYFKTYFDGQPTDDVLKTQRHFSNLFELPVLYYAGIIVAMIIPLGGGAIQFAAWLFVAARVAHAFIHLGSNKLYPRMLSYATGWLSVIAIWILILIAL